MGCEAYRCLLAAICCLSCFAGCNRDAGGPAVVEVSGTVTQNGNAVEGANVVFYPEGGGTQSLASQAVTDANGRCALSTHVGGGKFKLGIVPGKYGVAITKVDTASIKSTLAPPPNLLPKKYATPKTSGLHVDVAAGKPNDFPFALDEK